MKKIKNIKKSRKKDKLALPIQIMICAAVFFILTIPVILAVDQSKPLQKIEGRIIGLYQTQTQTGGRNVVIIKLIDERVVYISRAGLGEYVKGKRVLVQEYKSRILGRSTFKFIKYIEYKGSAADIH